MKRSFKQLLALVCTLALLASFTTAFAAANQFTDVPSSYWAHNEIAFVVDKGLFNGTTATQFSPDAQMKRGQLAAVLYRYAGSPAVSGTSGYADVASTAYYADACAWAKQNGIFMADKLDAASLNPDEGITRSEFAVMLYNFAKLNGKAEVNNSAENPYADMTNVSNEIKTAIINWAVPAGILGGTTDTTMNPFGAIKRSHVAAMLYRYDTKIAHPGSVTEEPEETTPSTSETTSYGPGDTVAPVKGGAYTVTIGVGEKCYMDATKMGADWIEHYVNQFASNGHQIAEVPWDSSVNKSAIIGKVPGTMTIECLSTADYKTVFATIKVTVTGSSSSSSGNSGSTGNTGSASGNLTEQKVYNAIMALKTEYPEGMTWTNDNVYDTPTMTYRGCAAFGAICAEAAFGSPSGKRVNGYEGARVGDRIRFNDHTVVVLEDAGDYYVVTQGNYNGKISWEDNLPKSILAASDLVYIETNW